MKQIKTRYEIECSASNTITRHANSLRGVLRHLRRMQGMVSILDRQTDTEFFLGSPRQGYNLIKTMLGNYGGNEDIVMSIFISNSRV